MSQEIDIFISELENYFNNLKPSDLLSLDKYYANEAHFKDPFNDVTGCAHIKAIFEHMFQVLESPRFVVTERLFDAEKAFMCWDFIFSPKTSPAQVFVIKGSTYLSFCKDDEGQFKISVHRDYWDPAQEIYEKIPILGSFFRWLRKQSSAPLK
jgi:steroid delta-isomerase